MDKISVACAQQQARLYDDVEMYRQDLHRFLRLAANKGARLLVFPELAGTMLSTLLMSGVGLGLLRAVQKGSEQGASWWARARAGLAATAAGPFRGGLRSSLDRLLEKEPDALRSLYMDVFSRAAREWGLTIVAGSSYLVDSALGARTNEALVFGPDGALLGSQAKIHLYPEDQGLAEPGREVRAIDTPVARIGVLFGTDALYPEMGRTLALQGAEVLICLAACPGRLLARKVRHAFEARVQENQTFGAIAFLVGKNLLGLARKDDYVGRSGVLVPWEMSPRGTGILVELGTEQGQGIVAGTLDFDLLGQARALTDTPLRRALRADVVAPYLTAFYQSGQTLQEAARLSARGEALRPAEEAVPTFPEMEEEAPPVPVTPEGEAEVFPSEEWAIPEEKVGPEEAPAEPEEWAPWRERPPEPTEEEAPRQ
ncbi:MAG: nitrilase-related carbon-nitrogen hydrolase [Anaerolineae bacterium]